MKRKRRKRSTDGGNNTRSERPQWADVTEHSVPKKTCANARVAIEALGVSCRYDEFHDRVTIALAPTSKFLPPSGGSAIEHVSGADLARLNTSGKTKWYVNHVIERGFVEAAPRGTTQA
jgi:hypothetical protein